MKKRPRRKPSKPPSAKRRSFPPEASLLQYKVVELSTVDEAALEQAVNVWVQQGWTVESVHFAMRESSKRPAMAFVFFTRANRSAPHDAVAAHARLQRLAEGSPAPARAGSEAAWERLAQLATSGEPEP
ncbi:MAG: hypothetical protein ACLQDQ_02075 [Myxococcaceae bacterium]